MQYQLDKENALHITLDLPTMAWNAFIVAQDTAVSS